MVFHEYVMCKEFQAGVMEDQWAIYRGFVADALKYEILKQEYAYFRANRTLYKSPISDRFFQEIDSLSDVKNWTEEYSKMLIFLVSVILNFLAGSSSSLLLGFAVM